MLAIVTTALLTMLQKARPECLSSGKKWLICATTWLTPISTSIAAVGLDSIAPTRWNWCWISATPMTVQYALADGWRFAIMFTIVIMFVYMGWILHSRFRMRKDNGSQTSLSQSDLGTLSSNMTMKDHLNHFRHASHGSDRSDSAGSGWLPIQYPNALQKKFATSPGRQIGHVNSLHHLGMAPRRDPRAEHPVNWFHEMLRMSRCISQPPTQVENGQTARDSSESGTEFPIQLPEVLLDNKPIDLFSEFQPPDEPEVNHSRGPRYHNQCPKVSKSFQVSVHHTQSAVENWTLGGIPLDEKPGPNYHNQCPKVTKSFQVSIGDSTNALERMSSDTSKPGPRYHNQCPKVTRTVDVSEDLISSLESSGPRYHNQCPKVTRTVEVSEDQILPLLESSGPHYHNQCPKVTRTIGISVDPVSTAALVPREEGSGPNYHNQCPKVTRTIDVSTVNSSTPSLPSSSDSQGPHYHQECPKVQRSFSLKVDRSEKNSEAEPGPRYHNQCPKVTRSVTLSSSRQTGPNYHNQCPLVKRSLSVSINPVDQLSLSTDSTGPRYHNQCPKVTRTVRLSSSGDPLNPSAPPLVLLPGPHQFKTETTVVTSPMAPPPSPTPGLPPPPWSPAVAGSGSRIQFKRPALFSRSTWSESSHSSRIRGPSSPWSETSMAAITNRVRIITQDLRSRYSSALSTLRDDEGTDTDNDTEDGSDISAGREVRRALLSNLYPLLYILFWLPYMVHHFMDAQGVHADHPRALAVMEGMSEWIPLANTLTLGITVCMQQQRASDCDPYTSRLVDPASAVRRWRSMRERRGTGQLKIEKTELPW